MIIRVEQQGAELYFEAETPFEGACIVQLADKLAKGAARHQLEVKPTGVRLVVSVERTVTGP